MVANIYRWVYMMTDVITLLPCPFCGCKPARFTWKKNLDKDSYYITYGCTKKDHTVQVYGDSDYEAIERWNRRYTEDDLK